MAACTTSTLHRRRPRMNVEGLYMTSTYDNDITCRTSVKVGTSSIPLSLLNRSQPWLGGKILHSRSLFSLENSARFLLFTVISYFYADLL